MDFKKLLPHLIAIAGLLGVAMVFFAPNAFSGKTLAQSDNTKARGMAAEIKKYRDSTGVSPLWTNSAFGGMPSYQIYAGTPGNLTEPLTKVIFLGRNISSMWTQVFAAMFCMYLFLLALKTDWRVAVFGALAYGITTYNVDILEAGHTTKMMALALAPGMLAGAVYAFRGKYILGTGMLAVFTAMQMQVNHFQITYYTFIMIGLMWLVKLVFAFKKKDFVSWGKALAFCILGISLGFLSTTSKVWPTYEYSKETIRGASNLKAKADKGDGLDKDYLFGWSYGIGETMTILVPHVKGGAAGENYDNTAFYKKLYPLIQNQAQQNGQSAAQAKKSAQQQVAGMMYSGSQPFVGTSIYFGAIVFFLALLGAFLVQGEAKVWLLTSGLVMLSFAWGKNFFLNHIFYDIMPMFNKFRAVSMALGISQLCFAGLAALGLQKLMDGSVAMDKKQRSLYIAGGLSVFFLLVSFVTGGGSGPNDNALAQNPQLLRVLEDTRASLVKKDVFRSFLFIAFAFGTIWMYLKGRLKAAFAVGIIAGLALADHWGVASRTLRPEKYEPKKEATAAPQPIAADKQIWQLAKDDPHYRVLDLARGGITGNATTSYFHKSISGYHAAKLQRFQEVVDKYFSGDNANQNIPKMAGMLNAKYVINNQGQVQPNRAATGNAWFVRDFTLVDDADTELNSLGRLDPKTAAVLQKSFAAELEGFTIQADSTASIQLTSYHPDKMEYSYSTNSDQLAIFSEMYYPPSKGWKVNVNGESIPEGFMKADYLLRALKLPANQNGTVTMTFAPDSVATGTTISMLTSLLGILLFLGGLFLYFKQNGLSSPSKIDDIEAVKASKSKTKTTSKKVKKSKKR